MEMEGKKNARAGPAVPILMFNCLLRDGLISEEEFDSAIKEIEHRYDVGTGMDGSGGSVA